MSSSFASISVMPRRQTKPRRTLTLRQRDGALCVSFVNTRSDQRHAPRHYADLLLWLERHDALSAPESGRYAVLAKQRPEEAEAAYALAERLGTLLSSIFNGLADRRELSPEWVEAFNVHLLETIPRQCLVRGKTGWRWDWAPGREDDLGRPLWSVIRSAARILASKYHTKVKRCAGEECDLLFIGNNSGSRRKWCSMKACGKRAKSQRHYYQTVKPRRILLQAAAKEKIRRRNEKYRRSLREKSRPPDGSEA